MYITAETIIQAAAVLGACGTLVGAIIAVYKILERDKRQSKVIADIQNEQTIICYGILACLKGLKEQGCNGPVTEALNKMEKHLNQKAHEGNVT